MKTSVLLASALVSLCLAGAARAQHTQPSPYAGFEGRTIKALSPEQIADLRSGRGMGLALAAELNDYPGPQHVLDLASELGLSESQHSQIRQLIAAMKAEAIPLGETLIAQEAALDALFATRSVTPERLAEATRAIGSTMAALRNTHLKYHLATPAILSAHQSRRYAELRGYAHSGHSGNAEHGNR